MPSSEPLPRREVSVSRQERERIGKEAQAQVPTVGGLLRLMSLSGLLSVADGYPVVIKQFLQLCLLLFYPAWVVAVAMGAVVGFAIYSMLRVALWPVRALTKRTPAGQSPARQKK